jgi:lysophospholipase L1-like esterase
MTVIGPAPSGVYDPTHPAFSYTDHVGVSVDTTRARFQRPLSFANLQHAAPGARIRFRSEAPSLTVRMGFNGLLVTTHSDMVSIIVDGVATDYPTTGFPASFNKTLTFAKPAMRNVEIIMPYYADGLDFFGVTQHPAYRLEACLPRPTEKLLVIGDSISEGAHATAACYSWSYLLAKKLKMQIANMGYGGSRVIDHGSASYVSAINPDLIVVLLGLNDAVDGTAEATFKTRYTNVINGCLSGSTAPIYAVTPIWTNAAGSIATYRTWIAQAVAAIGNYRVTVIDGLALCTNSIDHVPDGKHPNSSAHEVIADNLYSRVI